jgi:hypothetical protein
VSYPYAREVSVDEDARDVRRIALEGSADPMAMLCENGGLHNHYPRGDGLATRPGRRARLRSKAQFPVCETKEVRPRPATAVP